MSPRVRLRLTTEDRARADELAVLLGAKSWMTVVFLVLHGTLEEAEGRLDDRGREMLRQLRDGIQGAPQLPPGTGLPSPPAPEPV